MFKFFGKCLDFSGNIIFFGVFLFCFDVMNFSENHAIMQIPNVLQMYDICLNCLPELSISMRLHETVKITSRDLVF